VSFKMGSDCCKIRQVFLDNSSYVTGVTELKVFFDHTCELLLQLNQVSCSCIHYWGRPTCFSRNRLSLWIGLRTGRAGNHKEFVLWGVFRCGSLAQ
jgi:hypothetical protein